MGLISPATRVETTLAATYTHGTGTAVALVSLANVPTGGGVALIADSSEWCLVRYAAIDGPSVELRTLTAPAAVNASAGASGHAFAAGSLVCVAQAADYVLQLLMGAPTELTIDTGAVTVDSTKQFAVYLLLPESGNTDDLATINGGAQGLCAFFRVKDSGKTITFKDGAGNIKVGGADVALAAQDKYVMLLYSVALSQWIVVGGTGAGGGLTAQAAQTVLANATNDVAVPTPIALAVQQVLGRLTDGNIKGLSVAELVALTGLVTNASHTGEVTGSTELTIAANAVTLAKLATQAAYTVLANLTAGAAVPTAATVAQMKTLLAYLADLLDDTTPQLGGDLDLNMHGIQITPTLGSDHTWSGHFVLENVGETVAFGETLYFDCSEGEWKLADADQIGTMPVQGMALEAKTDGQACKILILGYIRHDAWSWQVDDVKKLLYASVTPGAMSVDPVDGTGDLSQAVAFIRTATTIFFNPSLDLTERG